MRKLYAAMVSLLVMGASGQAADLPPQASAPAVSPAYDWTGFYVGAMGGYGRSQNVTVAGVTTGTSDIKGGFAGGTFGFNWQAAGSPFVAGVEVDAAWSDIKFSSPFILGTTFNDRIQAFGSTTGRAGYAVGPGLFYVKGGYAWAQNNMAVLFGATPLLSESHLHSGWTIGGGAEYGFTANWSAKAEYMYASYASTNYLTAFALGGVGFGFDVHTVKAGLNYRFGGGPVVARY